MGESDSFTSSSTKKPYNITVQNVNCNSKLVIYLITCALCSAQYVGRTDSSNQKLKQRHNGHHSEWRNGWRQVGDPRSTPLGRHFYNCVGSNVVSGMMKIQIIDQRDFINNDIADAEGHWQVRLEPAINIRDESTPDAYGKEFVKFHTNPNWRAD